jgi:hypothetical protein
MKNLNRKNMNNKNTGKMKVIKTYLKSFSTSRIDFSTIVNILKSFNVSLSRNKITNLLRYLNSNHEIINQKVAKILPDSIEQNVKDKIFKQILSIKTKLIERGEDLRSVIESQIRIMNIFTNHIYNFLNLHYLKACEELSQNKPYDKELVDYIPVINEQFIRYISQTIYGHSESKSKNMKDVATKKRNEKIASLKEKIENYKKGNKSIEKMLTKLGKLEFQNTEFYIKLPEKIRESLKKTKELYIQNLGLTNKNREKEIFPKIYGLSMIVCNKIKQINTSILNMFKFTTYSLCKRYLKWELRNSDIAVTNATIHKVIMGEYKEGISALKKFQEIIGETKNFLTNNDDFRSMLLLKYKILKRFYEHNHSGKNEKQVKLFGLLPNKQTFNIDHVLYDKTSVIYYFKRYLFKEELEELEKIDKKDKNKIANFIFKKLFNFKNKKNYELINFSTDGLAVSLGYADRVYIDKDKTKNTNRDEDENEVEDEEDEEDEDDEDDEDDEEDKEDEEEPEKPLKEETKKPLLGIDGGYTYLIYGCKSYDDYVANVKNKINEIEKKIIKNKTEKKLAKNKKLLDKVRKNLKKKLRKQSKKESLDKKDFYKKKSTYIKISSKEYYHKSKINETKRALNILFEKNPTIKNIRENIPEKNVFESNKFLKYTK